MTDYAKRLSALTAALRDRGLSAAVIAPSDHMRYLIGWSEPGYERLIALVICTDGGAALVVPPVNADSAGAAAGALVQMRVWQDADGWEAALGGLLPSEGVVAVDDELGAGHLLRMQALAPRLRWAPGEQVLAELRSRKSPQEIERMEGSGALADAVCAQVLASLARGLREEELYASIGERYHRAGADDFMALVCFGANAASPHHRSDGTALADGDVVVLDTGARLAGYWSDITRTVAFGAPDPEARRVYDLVYRAHRAGFAAVRPGATGEDVDRAAREVIEAAGYGDRFTHRTGHGLGLSVHEPPYLVGGSREPLREGSCVTVEPGVYLPGRFGVRVEAAVTVTASGARYLNVEPPAELEVVEVR